jgi:cytochrome c oxidase subunit 2
LDLEALLSDGNLVKDDHPAQTGFSPSVRLGIRGNQDLAVYTGIWGRRTAQLTRLAFLAGASSVAALASSSVQQGITSIFDPHSTPGHEEYNIAMLSILVCTGIFIVVASLIIYASVRYRRRANDDDQEPPQVYGSNQIEAAWTVIPVLIVFVLIMVTARVVAEVQEAKVPPNALRASVIGHQWWWEMQYPSLGIVTANEFHMPLAGPNRQETFVRLQSVDVAHSFWIPQLSGKTDVIPNRDNTIWFDPTELGTYLGNCAEYCGTQHANMFIRVIVQPQDEFQKWVKAQQQPAVEDPSAAAGKQAYLALSCVSCHTVRGTTSAGKFGPDLTHLMSRETLASGMMRNTRQNLRSWVQDPQAMKPGCLMPSMQLTNKQLDAVVSYLVTLK